MDGIQLFNKIIKKNIIDNTKYLKGRNNYLPKYLQITKQLVSQQKIRQENLSKSLTVPPLMILSVTNDCNLKCQGCYANSQDREKELEMTTKNLDRVIQEGIDLGVGIFLIAGGEPLMKEGLLDIISKHKKTIFLMFTNGLMISEIIKRQIKELKQLIPIFSLEGSQETTDLRRGSGVFKAVISKMEELDRDRILFGTSITLTRQNYNEVMNDHYIKNLEEKGCRVLFLIEYVPCNGDKELCLKEGQKVELLNRIKRIKKDFSLLPVPLPGDESFFGGCLAAGRGFVHISSTGALEACPFAPYSDVTLKNTSLETALRSRLIAEIRENHHMLEESEGGCALFENPKWVSGLIPPKNKKTCSSIMV